MAEIFQQPEQPTPSLRDDRKKPAGVVPKQAQTYVIVALALLILFAVMFSKPKTKPVVNQPGAVPIADTSEVNARKVEELKQNFNQEQRQSELAQKSATTENAMQPASSTAGGTTATPQTTTAQSLPAPTEPPRDPIADAEKALAFKSRFSSNLVSAEAAQRPAASEPTAPQQPRTSGLSALDQSLSANNDAKKHPEVNVNSATGQPLVLFEGTTIDTTLVNRLNGDFAGPIRVMVTNPVYSHDRQHVVIPEGSFVVGDVQHVETTGQRRLAVTFHRLLMPDGYSVDLDRFHGLNQIGETGLNDKTDNHYVQIFGASIALGIIAGATEATTNSGLAQSGSDAYRQGVASGVSQSAGRVLDRFLNILPTITIREGHRIKVYLTQDLLLPAYENHTVPPNI